METTDGNVVAAACRQNSVNDTCDASASVSAYTSATSTTSTSNSSSTFFESSNISSSTTFDSETLSDGPESACPSPVTVIERTQCDLGKLSRKQSPLNQLGKPQQLKSYSLRTEVPFYVRNIFSVKPSSSDSTTALRKRQRKAKGTAAMNTMNGANGAQNVLDMNRNNGFFQNGTIMTSANAEKREHLYKILVIGELGTGKTSFIKRYVHQFFSQNYRATIGVDFALKVLHWDPNTIVRLQLWDIAGQERFGNMTRVYYKEAVGAFIVFDVTRSGTFECVSKWKEDLDSKVQLPDGSPIPCILLANKCDQEKQGIVTQPEKMDEYVKENGFSGWFETSAKENTNIDEAARALVSKILLNDKLISAADLADSEKFNLNNALDEEDLESKKCSC